MSTGAISADLGAERLRNGPPLDIEASALIAGEWISPRENLGTLEVHDSSTGAVVARIRECSANEVDAAVSAASEAFPVWSSTSLDERAAVLREVSAGLKARATQIAETIAIEVGMPLDMGRFLQVGLPRATFSNTAKILATFEFEREIENSLVVREPFGVVGAITPWNYPLHQIALKVAPAIAAGNTVVLKPSEIAPLNAIILADVLEQAGLPPGVVNIVLGRGPTVGEALASHPDVRMVSFTGSTAAGRRVAALGAETVKKVALELGGKSANIILDDADLSKAVVEGLGACFRNSGQTCTALSRMLVPRGRLAEVEGIIDDVLADFQVGDPLDDETRVGPLVSADQKRRVLEYVDSAIAEGARVLGDANVTGLESGGYFVTPIVLSNVRPDMRVAVEEIFGPVLCLIGYDTEDEAIAIANDSIYGLSGSVWSADPARAESVARRIQTGRVDINGATFNVLAPFGGHKQSGLGREAGEFGLDEFLEWKSIQR